MDDKKLALKVSVTSIFVNIFLSVFKFIAGVISGSSAMISDAVHSASDITSTIVVLIGIKAASKTEDKHHPYGHERMECVAGLILAIILGATGFFVGWQGLQKLLSGINGSLEAPSAIALIAAAVSIATKEWMFRFTRKAAKKVDSSALMADAWHHRSDALSSIGSLVGVGGAMLGLPILDPIASLVICVMIIKAAIDILKDALDKMLDSSCDENTINLMKECIASVSGVKRIDLLKTRMFSSKIYVDLEISVDAYLPLIEAHKIAETVHISLENNFPKIKHCMVHINPYIE